MEKIGGYCVSSLFTRTEISQKAGELPRQLKENKMVLPESESCDGLALFSISFGNGAYLWQSNCPIPSSEVSDENEMHQLLDERKHFFQPLLNSIAYCEKPQKIDITLPP